MPRPKKALEQPATPPQRARIYVRMPDDPELLAIWQIEQILKPYRGTKQFQRIIEVVCRRLGVSWANLGSW